MKELDAKARELRELRRMREEIDGEINAIVDEIKAEMVAQGTEELAGTDWAATWHTVQSTRLDTKALKRDQPELYALYSVPTVTCRFCLT